ncbi:MAG: PilZ domain-containing protein [Deltaproteobacteria bacterium]|jgi:hypothetical protein|nr:PilZ domain-containing protein [Deltaproteobacteria bacterium]MBW2477532.1 PilZ domain-containing protein [Deltaproteobacteria bacterium]MBW2502940.1 PilZ domain-containing protein [Deltaproteobacteria bacterium]MBW2520380.1 PilZ domain-containing protein [Deltaproteobacteria bacterium]
MTDNPFERRRSERCYALKFLDYEVLSDEGVVVDRGLARTLNVSESGLLLETGQFFEPRQKLRITLGLSEDLVQMTGQIVHSEPIDEEVCSAGVMFLEFEPDDRGLFQKHFQELKSALPT